MEDYWPVAVPSFINAEKQFLFLNLIGITVLDVLFSGQEDSGDPNTIITWRRYKLYI